MTDTFTPSYIQSAIDRSDWRSQQTGENRIFQYESELKNLAEEPEEIVEIGCGPGVTTVQLAEIFPGAHVTGVDLSHSSVRRARQENSRENIDYCEREALDFLDEREESDLIAAPDSVNYLVNLVLDGEEAENYVRQFLEKSHKAAEDGGVLFISTGKLYLAARKREKWCAEQGQKVCDTAGERERYFSAANQFQEFLSSDWLEVSDSYEEKPVYL